MDSSARRVLAPFTSFKPTLSPSVPLTLRQNAPLPASLCTEGCFFPLLLRNSAHALTLSPGCQDPSLEITFCKF